MPNLVLGADESATDQHFLRISSVLRTPSGGVIVADAGTGEIAAYDADGTMRFRVGGKGPGPQESQVLRSLGDWDDTSFYTFDRMAQRLAIWSRDGAFQRTISLYHLGRAENARQQENGQFVAAFSHPVGFPRAVGERTTDTLVVLQFDTNGVATSELLRMPFRHTVGFTSPRGGVLISAMPTDPEGVFWLGATAAFYGWSADSAIVRADYQTGRIDTLWIALPARPVTSAIIDALVKDRLETVAPDEPTQFEVRLRNLPFLPHLPRFDRIIEDEEGLLWIRQYPVPPDTIARWLVMAPDGGSPQEILFSVAFDPMHISKTDVTGVLLDELDRHQVVGFPLRRRQ